MLCFLASESQEDTSKTFKITCLKLRLDKKSPIINLLVLIIWGDYGSFHFDQSTTILLYIYYNTYVRCRRDQESNPVRLQTHITTGRSEMQFISSIIDSSKIQITSFLLKQSCSCIVDTARHSHLGTIAILWRDLDLL